MVSVSDPGMLHAHRWQLWLWTSNGSRRSHSTSPRTILYQQRKRDQQGHQQGMLRILALHKCPTSNHSARGRNPYFIASSRAPLQVRGSGHLAAVATIKRLLLRSAFVAIRITRLTRIITIRSRAGKLIPSGILRNCKKISLYSAGVRKPHACSRQRILWAHCNVIRTRFGTRCPCVQGFMADVQAAVASL